MKRLLPVWAALLIAAAPVAALWAPGTAVAAGAGVTFQETPSLAGRVAEGKLPPVEDRVPKVPSVVFMNAKDKTPGRHGGDMRLIMGKGRDVRLMTIYGYARLVAYTTDLKLVADILERFEVKDGREFTLTLRPGHKWSDGHPFTAEDFRYYWQDMATNKKLSPLGPRKKLLVGEELPEFKVIDKRTVRYTWSRPNSFFLAGMAGAAPFFIYRPAHYMKRFHARYSDTAELKKMAEKERLMDWSVLHQSKDRMYTLDNPEMPTLQPWMNTTKPPSQRFVFVRNPFFHRVDAAGRQLPYIDRVIMNISLRDLIPAKAGAGESDLQSRYIAFEDYTFLKESEKRYDQSVHLWRTVKGSHIAIYPNLNTKDPAWRKILRDVRFRRALSLAIDRNEINQVAYFGLARGGNNSIIEESPLFRPEYRTLWAGFDLARANRLLDEMGLDKKDGDGIRLLPDGRSAIITIDTSGEKTEITDILELIHDTWLKAGIKMLPRPAQRDIFRNRVFSGDSKMAVWSGLSNGIPTADMTPDEFVPTRQYQLQWPKWGKFMESNGQAGKPPDLLEAKQLLDLMSAWNNASGLSEQEEIWHRILKIHAEQVFSIGIINRTLQPVVVNNRLRNVPAEGFHNWNPGAYFGVYRPDTFWFAGKGKDRG